MRHIGLIEHKRHRDCVVTCIFTAKIIGFASPYPDEAETPVEFERRISVAHFEINTFDSRSSAFGQPGIDQRPSDTRAPMSNRHREQHHFAFASDSPRKQEPDGETAMRGDPPAISGQDKGRPTLIGAPCLAVARIERVVHDTDDRIEVVDPCFADYNGTGHKAKSIHRARERPSAWRRERARKAAQDWR